MAHFCTRCDAELDSGHYIQWNEAKLRPLYNLRWFATAAARRCFKELEWFVVGVAIGLAVLVFLAAAWLLCSDK